VLPIDFGKTTFKNRQRTSLPRKKAANIFDKYGAGEEVFHKIEHAMDSSSPRVSHSLPRGRGPLSRLRKRLAWRPASEKV
jgi:hypothetical protein